MMSLGVRRKYCQKTVVILKNCPTFMLMKYLFKIDLKKVSSIPNVYQSTFTIRKFLHLNLGIHQNWCLKIQE